MRKLKEYDVWYRPCERCGRDSGKMSKESENRCWKCGGPLKRDFSDRALKVMVSK